jgi:hypothetical protein
MPPTGLGRAKRVLQGVAVRHRVDQRNLGRKPHAFNLAYDRFGS